jgi:hypothetical protein
MAEKSLFHNHGLVRIPIRKAGKKETFIAHTLQDYPPLDCFKRYTVITLEPC